MSLLHAASPSTAPAPPDRRAPRQTVRLFLIVSAAILAAEFIALVILHRLDPHQDLLHEAVELGILTVLISALVYRFLLLPLNREVELRRKAEELARAEQAKQEGLTEALGAGMVLLDRDHRVQWANRTMRELFDTSAGAICYSSFRQSDGVCTDCGAGDIFSGKAERVVGRHRLTTRGGGEAWFDVIFTPVRDAASSTIAALELLVPADDRKKMEDALRLSNERYQDLLESTADWIWEIDPTGRLTFSSHNSREIVGYDPDEVLGMTPFPLIVPAERQETLEFFQECARDRKPFMLLENRLLHRDGREVAVQVSGIPFFDADGAFVGFRGITRDISQRKSSEAALRESEQNFRALAELAGDGMIIARENGSIIFTNRKIAEITGRSGGELGTLRLADLAPGDHGLTLERNCRARIAGGAVPAAYEIRLLHRSGREVPVEITGARILWGGIPADQLMIRDISERKAHEAFRLQHQMLLEQQVQEKTRELQEQVALNEREMAVRQAAEAALRSSEEQFRELFLQSEAALLLFDAANEAIIDANPAALALFGYGKEELLRLDGKLLVVPESHQSLAEFLHATHGRDHFNVRQATGRTRDGRQLIVSLWGKVVRLRAREVIYCSLTDISERIRMEEEKKLIHTKLIQVNKMNSLGLLASGIAHEINNPNTNILLSAQLLDRSWLDLAPLLERLTVQEGDFLIGGTPVSELRESLPRMTSTIVGCARRIEGIISNLREFAIQGKATMADNVDLNRIVSVAASILQHQVKRSTGNFRLGLADGLPKVQGNAQQLEQVIINLLMNALQSLPGPDRAVEMTTEWDREADQAVISVRDEGCGIPPEHLSKVLDPFFSTKLERGGTGLGLAITSFIIREHNGTLNIDSTPGAGTTVTVRIPLSPREVNA
jgi:PAS domain S-box-containing protein